MSLADALAMGTAARNVVLVGDPQQLDQVLQGTHPSGSDASVLKHLIGDEATIPADRGIFLERTYRLHPDICAYISDEFYESRLEPAPVAASGRRRLARACGTCPSTTMRVGRSRRRKSPPSHRSCGELAAAGVAPGEIMVVAPYNAQVNALAARRCRRRSRVGTVDKFQGQEADVVIYSLASSSGEDVPRGLEFLLSRHRTNVAISRARCLAYLVASPRLLEVNTRTIEQMRLANALCRFVELALAGRTKAARRNCRRSLSCRSPQSLSKRRFRSTLARSYIAFKPLWPLALIIVLLGVAKLLFAAWQSRRLSRAGMPEIDRMDGPTFERRLAAHFRGRGFQAEVVGTQG